MFGPVTLSDGVNQKEKQCPIKSAGWIVHSASEREEVDESSTTDISYALSCGEPLRACISLSKATALCKG